MKLRLFSVLLALLVSACARSASDHLRKAQHLFSQGKNEAAQREAMLARAAAKKERARAEQKYQEAAQKQQQAEQGPGG